MPIYEYVCRHCGEELERLQKLSDAPLTDCPECGEPALKRKVSAAGFRLSGSGWYETDFKSDNRHNLAGDNNSAQAPDRKESSTSGNGKPAAGKESTKKQTARPDSAGAGSA